MLSRRTLIASGVSVAAIGALGYGLWPRLDGYREEIERQRRLLSDTPALEEFVRLSTLAASGHNAQPWKFRVDERAIGILPDLSRRTEVVDPDDHHLYVSLGCAAENLVIAARTHGRPADVDLQNEVEPRIDVTLGNGAPRDDPLYQAIPLRQSTRSAYDGQPISAADIGLLEAAAE